MLESIEEKIDVVAIFGKGFQEVKPYRIKWAEKEFTITKVNYMHKMKAGRDNLYVFSCTDGVAFFEIAYNSDQVGWVLKKVGDGEAN